MQIDKATKQKLLRTFNLVTRKGVKADGLYELSGIRASHDFDGYTCWLTYKDLTVTLVFHGLFNFDYQEESTLNVFFNKVNKLLIEEENERLEDQHH
jgi:hypothetical protein